MEGSGREGRGGCVEVGVEEGNEKCIGNVGFAFAFAYVLQ